MILSHRQIEDIAAAIIQNFNKFFYDGSDRDIFAGPAGLCDRQRNRRGDRSGLSNGISISSVHGSGSIGGTGQHLRKGRTAQAILPFSTSVREI